MLTVLVYGDFEIPVGDKTENFFFIQIPEGRIPWSKKIAPAINRIVQSFVPEPPKRPYRRPKTTKEIVDGVEHLMTTYYPRERKRRAHWNIEGDHAGGYLEAWNRGTHVNYTWNGTEFVRVNNA